MTINKPRGSNVEGGEIIKTLLDIQINNDEDRYLEKSRFRI